MSEKAQQGGRQQRHGAYLKACGHEAHQHGGPPCAAKLGGIQAEAGARKNNEQRRLPQICRGSQQRAVQRVQHAGPPAQCLRPACPKAAEGEAFQTRRPAPCRIKNTSARLNSITKCPLFLLIQAHGPFVNKKADGLCAGYPSQKSSALHAKRFWRARPPGENFIPVPRRRPQRPQRVCLHPIIQGAGGICKGPGAQNLAGPRLQRGCCWVMQCTFPPPYTISSVSTPTTSLSGKMEASCSSARASFSSPNCGTMTPPFTMRKFK